MNYFSKIFLSFFCGAALLAVLFGIQYFSIQPLREAGVRGMEWLKGFEGNYGNPGIIWNLHEINRRRCGSDEFMNFIRQKAQPAQIRDEVVAAYYSKTVEDIGARFPQKIDRGFDPLLLGVLYCKEGELSLVDEQYLFAVESARGYELTHKYLGLMFFREKQCVPRTTGVSIDERISTAARLIRADTGAWSDLYVEQIAFLLYGGFREFVSQKDIDTILAFQDASGGWSHSPPDAPNPHTTALAVWALAEWERYCPFP